MITLTFDKGTLQLNGAHQGQIANLDQSRWDQRTGTLRAPALAYRAIVTELHQQKIPYQDQAKDWTAIEVPLKKQLTPRPFQDEALREWIASGGRGVVVLPTGAGKTIVAVLAIAKIQRPTLIHVPTIDLMHQWVEVLKQFFDQPIGLWGGGYNETESLTVTTYDSALIHTERRGNRFALLVFDECHHLPGEQYQFTAQANIAPYRLGLTATPERSDGKEARLYELVGNICFRTEVAALEGDVLSPYRIETCELELLPEERAAYDIARKIYLDFLRNNNIRMSGAQGWQQFLWRSSQSAPGRAAFRAYREQKQLSLAAAAKTDKVFELLRRHSGDRILIFTQDNDMAYHLGRRFLLPVLTHQTRVKEREAFLAHFRSGEYPVLVTSKVLNEGVDVPEANVAIIVSGSGSVREHVQRLGRILRARPGKEAVLYELVSKGTTEQSINKRRRKHSAYQRPDSL